MTRKQLRLTRSVGTPIIFSLVLLIALTVSSLAQAAQGGLTPTVIRYRLVRTSPGGITVCMGEEKGVFAALQKTETPLGSSEGAAEYLPNIKIRANMGDTDIATVDPQQYTSIGIPSRAFFAVRGVSPGETILHFNIVSGVDPADGEVFTAGSVPERQVSVKVVPCYEAFDSSLATTWTKNMACSMANYFQLEGTANPKSGFVGTFVAKFTPDDTVQGSFTLTIRGNGVTHSIQSGRYTNGRQDEFVEMEMQGDILTVYDDGLILPLLPTSFHIEFKPAPSGTCK